MSVVYSFRDRQTDSHTFYPASTPMYQAPCQVLGSTGEDTFLF